MDTRVTNTPPKADSKKKKVVEKQKVDVKKKKSSESKMKPIPKKSDESTTKKKKVKEAPKNKPNTPKPVAKTPPVQCSIKIAKTPKSAATPLKSVVSPVARTPKKEKSTPLNKKIDSKPTAGTPRSKSVLKKKPSGTNPTLASSRVVRKNSSIAKAASKTSKLDASRKADVSRKIAKNRSQAANLEPKSRKVRKQRKAAARVLVPKPSVASHQHAPPPSSVDAKKEREQLGSLILPVGVDPFAKNMTSEPVEVTAISSDPVISQSFPVVVAQAVRQEETKAELPDKSEYVEDDSAVDLARFYNPAEFGPADEESDAFVATEAQKSPPKEKDPFAEKTKVARKNSDSSVDDTQEITPPIGQIPLNLLAMIDQKGAYEGKE